MVSIQRCGMRLRLHKSHVTCKPASCKCLVLVSLAGCCQRPQTKPCCAPSSKWDGAAAVSSRVLRCVQLAVLMDLNIFQLAIAVNVRGSASICTSTMHESRAEVLSQSMLSKVLVASCMAAECSQQPRQRGHLLVQCFFGVRLGGCGRPCSSTAGGCHPSASLSSAYKFDSHAGQMVPPRMKVPQRLATEPQALH